MKKTVKLIAIQILLLLMLACSENSADDVKYVGSKNSNIYHYTDCRWAKQILAKNLVEFSSAEDAKKHGYRPCKVCRPPLND